MGAQFDIKRIPLADLQAAPRVWQMTGSGMRQRKIDPAWIIEKNAQIDRREKDMQRRRESAATEERERAELREVRLSAWFRRASAAVDSINHVEPLRTVQTPTMARIVRAFVGVYGVTESEILGRGRAPNVIAVRHAIAYWIRRRTGKSTIQIGTRLGRDHATIIHAITSHQQRRAKAGRYLRPLDGRA